MEFGRVRLLMIVHVFDKALLCPYQRCRKRCYLYYPLSFVSCNTLISCCRLCICITSLSAYSLVSAAPNSKNVSLCLNICGNSVTPNLFFKLSFMACWFPYCSRNSLVSSFIWTPNFFFICSYVIRFSSVLIERGFSWKISFFSLISRPSFLRFLCFLYIGEISSVHRFSIFSCKNLCNYFFQKFRSFRLANLVFR